MKLVINAVMYTNPYDYSNTINKKINNIDEILPLIENIVVKRATDTAHLIVDKKKYNIDLEHPKESIENITKKLLRNRLLNI